jgi:hypothetical protein
MTSITADLSPDAARTPRVFGLMLRLLKANWTFGTLTVRLPNGIAHVLEGPQPGTAVSMDVRDYRFARRVLSNGDIGFAEGFFSGFTGGTFASEVDEHEVIVGTAGDDFISFSDECLGHTAGVVDNLLAVGTEFRLECFVEGGGFGGDDVLEGPALHPGENTTVEDGRHFNEGTLGGSSTPGIIEVSAHHDDAAAGSAECFVGSGGNDMAVGEWVVEEFGGDESGGMGNIAQQQCADAVGNSPEAGIVPVARVS